jgi:hypothetical protein
VCLWGPAFSAEPRTCKRQCTQNTPRACTKARAHGILTHTPAAHMHDTSVQSRWATTRTDMIYRTCAVGGRLRRTLASMHQHVARSPHPRYHTRYFRTLEQQRWADLCGFADRQSSLFGLCLADSRLLELTRAPPPTRRRGRLEGPNLSLCGHCLNLHSHLIITIKAKTGS